MEDKKSFMYNRLHFIPTKKLSDKEAEFISLSNHISSDRELGMARYEWRRRPYSYNGFYAKAKTVGAGEIDVFRCVETGRDYIPGDNELFIYKQ